MSDKIGRRDFLKRAGAAAVPMLFEGGNALAKDDMPSRPLGKTGHRVRLFSLGGQATLERPGMEDKAVEIINRAYDLGVNYQDTAAAYGPSQDYIGKVMKYRRQEVFLATKTHARKYDVSMRLLDDSLSRLQTDHLDLWQLHNITSQNDLDIIFSNDGAIRAFEKARDQKLVRFLGITGHFDPNLLLQGIKRYPFDCILMALNPADVHHLPFQTELLNEAKERSMGIIGMKIPARGGIFNEKGITNIAPALNYVWTLMVSTVIVGCDNVAQLEENVSAAKVFKPYATKKMQEIESLTVHYARKASFFKNWS